MAAENAGVCSCASELSGMCGPGEDEQRARVAALDRSPWCPLCSINQNRDPVSMGWLCNTFEGAPYREKFFKSLILF